MNKEFEVKYCLDCKQAYEMDRRDILYYTEFPTYGLQRETCCNCEKTQLN